MKAAVYDVAGAPGVLKYVDIPDPITGPDDILLLSRQSPLKEAI
ncbi:hypothetical protein [Klebsiella variicola]|nr:hypothetical protein [Klebsiella variicola]